MQHIKRRAFAAVGFIRYKWKHSENNKESDGDFQSFLIVKFEYLD